MKKMKWDVFKVLCVFTGVIFAYLFLTLFLNSRSFLIDLGLQPDKAAIILTRRASMFMLGISILMIGSVNLPHSKARQIICLSTAISMLGLSIMGSYEFVKGTVNSSILIAIIIETILWLSFGLLYIRNRKAKISQQ